MYNPMAGSEGAPGESPTYHLFEPLRDQFWSRLLGIMSNRRILITGVGRGLGLAMTEKFIELGHTVVGCGRQKSHVEKLAKRFGPPHRFGAVDVTDDDAVSRWANEVLQDGGPPDLLLNNA